MLPFMIAPALYVVIRLKFADGVRMLFFLDVWLDVPVAISGLVGIIV